MVKDNKMKILMFIMVFTSSLISVQINNISLNKIGIIPLYIYLIYKEGKNRKNTINKNTYTFLLFIISSIFSAVFSIIYPIREVPGLINAQVNYLIQVIIIYIPMLILLTTSNRKEEYSECFFDTLIKVIRIHAIFIVCQFVIYTLFKVNISSLIFDELLGGITGNSWTSHVYGRNIVLRASGLNYDPAFASYLLICGFIFDKNKIFRLTYVICTILAQSRTGLICIIILYIFDLATKIFKDSKITKKQIIYIMIWLVILTPGIYILYKSNSFMNQLSSIFDRISDVFSNSSQDISTLRHSNYPAISIKVWESFKNIIYYLFGVGPRASGIALINYSQYNYLNFEFSANMINNVWSIECDLAELLLGHGIIGFILYYLQIIKFIINRNKRIKLFGVAILIMGFMYDFSLLTINVLLIVFLLVFMINQEEKKELQNE